MLKVHFINVGHGDCCLIEFPSGRNTVVDVNRSVEMDSLSKSSILEAYFIEHPIAKSSLKYGYLSEEKAFAKAYNIKLTDPIEFIKDKAITNLFRFISTHPHKDHNSGIKEIKDNFSPTNYWVIKNEFNSDNNDSDDLIFYNELVNNDVSSEFTIVRPLEQSNRDFWNQDGITILAPNNELVDLAVEKDNPNIMSYVLLIKYGKIKIILGGDAESDTWKYLTENYSDELENVQILKASHHGRDSGYYMEAVKLMSPKYTIVSVGKKPSTDSTNKYRNFSENTFSTRWKGNITFECQLDGTIEVITEYER